MTMRAALREAVRQQRGEQERPQVVGREGELEAVDRGAVARAHHAGVVDEEPERRVVAAHRRGASRTESSEARSQWTTSTLARGSCVQDLLTHRCARPSRRGTA